MGGLKMSKRTVMITMDDEFMAKNAREKRAAIGYLATWAHMDGDTEKHRYMGQVNIYCDDERGEITAHYHNSKGERTYVIGAIEREDGSFSFHS